LLILSKRWNSAETPSSSFQVQRHIRTILQRNNQRIQDVPNWIKRPPTQDESHERTHQNNIYKWCETCGKWFFGSQAHFTNEHIQGFCNHNPSLTSPTVNNITPSFNHDNQDITLSNTNGGVITRTYFQDDL
jgi:hypothetical protein